MGGLGGPLVLSVSLLVGLGVGLITYAWARRRAGIARRRRLAQVMGIAQSPSSPPRRALDATWSSVRQAGRELSRLLIAHKVATQPLATLAILSGSLVGLVNGQPAWLLLVLPAGGVLAWLHRQSGGYRRLEQQAPAALEMFSAGLRAGYSVPQAIALVGREIPEPTASEFATVGRELAVGSSLADSLTHLAQRTALPDYTMVSTVIWIHGQVGGNLAVVLDSVVSTLRERFDLREQVRALTAQQRLASTTLSMLPVGMLGLLLLVDRPFVEPMFSLATGRIMLAIGSVLLAAGWATMRMITRVEV